MSLSYSFKNVNAIIGIHTVEGWASGDDALTIEPNAPRSTTIIGAKGEAIRSQSNDMSVKITLKLLQNSKSNAYLQTLETLDRETGTGVLPFIYTDKVSGESYIVANAWIEEMPSMVRGANQNDMVWVLRGDKAVPLIG